MLRWIGFVVLILLLLLTAYAGLTDGLSGIHQATGAGQWAATATQLVYGVCAILALAAMGARHRVATSFIQGWCIATILTSTLAPVVYGGANIIVGAGGGVGAALVSVLVLWIWKNRPANVNG